MIRSYKGYVPEIWYEHDDKAFHAIAQGIRSVIHAEASTLEEIQKEFELSVDTYLEYCREEGIEPQKPKSGNIAVRIAPEVHEMVADAANADAKSINQWIAEVLKEAAEKRLSERSIKIRIR
ncbi:type II toxin-antitoxin system HicB family antitoxin [Salaquimonas pukyongi]|uniref:type II toxin-antitoxin system HicB family antitoxin n=1 Tax=Salaquimonas pukyongi TaxID=2712698 RepID=UPI00096BB76C|nr:type II toxin-antitoxin system HicB family antitoxin [Salaquimonas pukyongi]